MQMDELTQQNGALVEEATAASQAMAQQARGLNDMMARYSLSDEAMAGAGSVQRQATRPAPRTEARTERRSAKRPWSDRTPPAATAAAPAPAKTAVNASETEWQEF